MAQPRLLEQLSPVKFYHVPVTHSRRTVSQMRLFVLKGAIRKIGFLILSVATLPQVGPVFQTATDYLPPLPQLFRQIALYNDLQT